MADSKLRLDQYLVDQGLAPSRTKAKELIEKEQVEVEGPRGFQVIAQPSFNLKSPPPQVRLISTELLKYVSRGGLKLEGALKTIAKEPQSFNVAGLECLDLGSSTGGFMDCLLKAGVKKVVGVDVGVGQLANSLLDEERVTNIEGLNVKDLAEDKRFQEVTFDLITGDLSFISIEHAFLPVQKLLRHGGHFLLLVKPQFELGRAALNKQGIVKDKTLLNSLESDLKSGLEKFGLKMLSYFPSTLEGRDGNQEFFIYGTHK